MIYTDDIESLYTEMLQEKKSSHNMKDTLALLKDAMKKGLVDLRETKNGFLVMSRRNDSKLLIHKTDKALHELRRFLGKLEKRS